MINIKILKNDYSIYHFLLNQQIIQLPIQPFQEKLFNDDLFIFENNKIKIINSPTRTNILQGILILKGNKTFGTHTNNKLIYKCIPYNKSIPPFLIPYQHKIYFQKTFSNLFINFKYTH